MLFPETTQWLPPSSSLKTDGRCKQDGWDGGERVTSRPHDPDDRCTITGELILVIEKGLPHRDNTVIQRSLYKVLLSRQPSAWLSRFIVNFAAPTLVEAV